ncbi:MAG: DNA polymerase elongation subunit (family B), partial [Thermoplasmata archaeon]|nr:DNA polymerase elongation subunit (family B) [Thermoplasmata archaeon]
DTRNLKMMYQSLKGMRNAGTHGILVASNVSCRQFNLWGGAKITTTGQRILYDAMRELESRNMRVVYGDTDGIYVGCARNSLGIPEVCRAFGVEIGKADQISSPDDVLEVIELLNERWRKKLDYPAFELEPEYSDVMLFVKHKNYLIWNARNGKLRMTTKGNNFKGSDKAPIARKTLEEIMFRVLRDHQQWKDENKVRESVKRSIKKHTLDIVEGLDLSKVKLEDLTIIQNVRPPSYYKERGGSGSVHANRAKALGKLLHREITASGKFRFVVTKMPLPGIDKPSKTGVKPIDYMYPLEALRDQSNIDLDWYKEMIRKYVKGAFGLADLERTYQRGLHEFM